MKLSSLISPNFINLNNNIHSKYEAIELIVDEFYKSYKISVTKEEVLRLIYEREELGGTIFSTGIAIPHARLANYNDMLIGICVPKNHFIIDEIEVKCIVLILTREIGSSLYIKTLATFAQISQDTEFFNRLTSSKTPDEFLSLLSTIPLIKELTLSDIMSTQLVKVSPSTTLKQLSDLFYKHGISYVPVVNEEDGFIGEVSLRELIREGLPDYVLNQSTLNFLNNLEPFDELLADEKNILVEKIMRKPGRILDESASIVEAAFEMVNQSRNVLPVAKKGKLIGVVSISDLLKKVIRG